MELSQYLAENIISDDQLYWIVGVNSINSKEQRRAQEIVKYDKISKSNPRPGVIRYAKRLTGKFADASEELIPRSQWDLKSLTGNNEYLLMHPDYYKLLDKLSAKKHDTLTLLQCTSVKPYREQRFYKKVFQRYYGDFTDFACITEPGIVPFEVSHLYPYRFDNWDEVHEMHLNDAIDMHKKYDVVNTCRFLDFARTHKYKNVIVYVWKEAKRSMFDYIYNNNIDGAKDWLHIVFNPNFIQTLYKTYPGFKGHPNLLSMRANNLPESFERYAKLLKSVEGDEVQKQTDIYNSVKESAEILSSIDPQGCIAKFKSHQPQSKYLYKSVYWTCLDILLMGLNGNFVRDIDKCYWDLMKALEKNKDFEKFGDYCFIYKPYLKDTPKEKCIKEAYRIRVCEEYVEPELREFCF